MEDIYKTPESDLNEISESEHQLKNNYYVVSKKKFTTLFLSTLGMYALFWFYQNWNKQKYYVKEKIYPVWRSLFAIFFVHSLLKRIDKDLMAIPLDQHACYNIVYEAHDTRKKDEIRIAVVN